MLVVFYIASIITVIASLKVICAIRIDQAILYLIISFLATATIFILLNMYFLFVLYLLIFICGAAIFFIYVAVYLKIRTDNIESTSIGISPKIWLGPLILAFILLVLLIYGVISNDYTKFKDAKDITHEMSLFAYLLIAELFCFLLLSAAIIAYHFMHRFLREE